MKKLLTIITFLLVCSYAFPQYVLYNRKTKEDVVYLNARRTIVDKVKKTPVMEAKVLASKGIGYVDVNVVDSIVRKMSFKEYMNILNRRGYVMVAHEEETNSKWEMIIKNDYLIISDNDKLEFNPTSFYFYPLRWSGKNYFGCMFKSADSQIFGSFISYEGIISLKENEEIEMLDFEVCINGVIRGGTVTVRKDDEKYAIPPGENEGKEGAFQF